MSERVRRAAWRASALPKRSITTPAAWPVRDEIMRLTNVVLECGTTLPAVDVHFRLEGALSPTRDNVVLVAHALTGTVRATEWWKGVIEPGGAIDPTRHAVLTANLLGGCDGTTVPDADIATVLAALTTRDQAAVLARTLDALGIAAPLLVCGGSLGGQVTLEFAASFPERVRAAVVLAAPAAQTAQGVAWNALMRHAIDLGGPEQGLALARMIGMLSYRTPNGLEQRFAHARSEAGEYRITEWLRVHADMLLARFNATSYRTLIDAMDTHDVGRGRGGIAAALAPVADRLTGVGIPGDLLYPAEAVQAWTTVTAAHYVDLPSEHGHDAFLLEPIAVSAILRQAIERAPAARALHAQLLGAQRERTSASGVIVERQITRRLRVAVAGCGHVGGAVLELLAGNPALRSRVHVSRVLVRDASRARPALEVAHLAELTSSALPLTDGDALLQDDPDVLVELIGGTTVARTLVERALARGIRVVTANKALLAECGPSLLALAHRHGTRIDFEGAVAGAIPIVRSVRSGAAGVGISAISGILNGTSNFVLDRMGAGASLADAVTEAQQLGYAEADPTRDLSGEDAEDKLRVLAWLAFGVDPRAVVIRREGITASTSAWAAQVAAEGDRVKLLARCRWSDGVVVGEIAPTRVSGTDPWSQVAGANNRLVIESLSAGALIYEGAGAGGRATAGAVLGDLLQG